MKNGEPTGGLACSSVKEQAPGEGEGATPKSPISIPNLIEKILKEEPIAIIVTSGERINSPYPSRRKFVVKFEKKTPSGTLPRYNVNYSFPRELFIEYIKKYCKFCKEETICLRHQTILEAWFLVGDESNREYEYSFYPSGFQFVLGMNHWWIWGNNDEIIIERPSGVIFKYRNHSPQSSYAFLITKINATIDFFEKLQYTVVKEV